MDGGGIRVPEPAVVGVVGDEVPTRQLQPCQDPMGHEGLTANDGMDQQLTLWSREMEGAGGGESTRFLADEA